MPKRSAIDGPRLRTEVEVDLWDVMVEQVATTMHEKGAGPTLVPWPDQPWHYIKACRNEADCLLRAAGVRELLQQHLRGYGIPELLSLRADAEQVGSVDIWGPR